MGDCYCDGCLAGKPCEVQPLREKPTVAAHLSKVLDEVAARSPTSSTRDIIDAVAATMPPGNCPTVAESLADIAGLLNRIAMAQEAHNTAFDVLHAILSRIEELERHKPLRRAKK